MTDEDFEAAVELALEMIITTRNGEQGIDRPSASLVKHLAHNLDLPLLDARRAIVIALRLLQQDPKQQTTLQSR